MADEFDSAVNRILNAGPALAEIGIDDNPDDGVRALKLSKATGISSNVIYPDLKQFDRQVRSSLAQNIVRNDPDLNAFVRNHTLANVISNDDYGNLARFSTIGRAFSAAATDWDKIRKVIGISKTINDGLWEGVGNSFGSQPFGSWLHESKNETTRELAKKALEVSPLGGYEWLVAGAGPVALEAFIRSGAAFMGGISGALQGAAKGIYAVGGEEAPANLLRDIHGGVENTMMGGMGHLPSATKSVGAAALVKEAYQSKRPWDLAKNIEQLQTEIDVQTKLGLKPSEYTTEALAKLKQEVNIQAIKDVDISQQIYEARQAAAPYIEAGVEPPRGVHPLIDRFKADVNRKMLDQLDQVLDAAEGTMTRARSQELFSQFGEQLFQSRTIRLSPEAIEALYKDRMPEAGDGLLGWVKDIDRQIETARATGHDIEIPLKDWVTYSTPELRAQLRQDTRLWDQGITEREATSPPEYVKSIASPWAQIKSQGFEPMFSWGDRRIDLQKAKSPEGFDHYHEFQMIDGKGKVVGDLTLVPDPATKTLHIEMIGGHAGNWANSFGPALIRDLLRQLKQEYPEYEYITGHRVTGAREEAGTTGEASARPVVKLKNGGDTLEAAIQQHNAFNEIIAQGTARNVGLHEAVISLKEGSLPPDLSALKNSIADVLEKIAPKANNEIVGAIAMGNLRATGMYMQYGDRLPMIFVDLFGPNPQGTARHEAIHFLRNQGFFKEGEWQTLHNAALTEGWIQRYNIQERYKGHPEVWIEEAVAEGYREWAKAKEKGEGPVAAIFAKMQQLWDAIVSQFRSITGREPNFNDIFRQVESGEVGQRTGVKPLDSKYFNPKYSIEENAAYNPAAAKEALDNFRATAIGLDAKTYKKLTDLVQQNYKEALEAHFKAAQREQKRTQSKEWKADLEAMRPEVEEFVRSRPEVAIDLFVGSGEFMGTKLRQRIPLLMSDLTPEQLAGLPRHYYAKEGIPVDALAPKFGFGTGEEMVAALIQYNKNKDGKTAQEMLRAEIDTELNRRMEEKYGKLEENIANDAMDQAVSDSQLNILSEEYLTAGLISGIKTIDKDTAKAEARRLFEGLRHEDTSFANMVTLVQRQATKIERALISGDTEAAVVGMQHKFIASVMAQEARRLEKENKAFTRLIKRHLPREVKNELPEVTNYIHDIMNRIGIPARRTLEDLQAQIEGTGQKPLKEYLQEQEAAGQLIPVYEPLLDPNWSKPISEFTVGEFRAVSDSLKTLAKHGRDALYVTVGRDNMLLSEAREAMIDRAERGRVIIYDADNVRQNAFSAVPFADTIRGFKASHLQMETMFYRYDGYDKWGPWMQTLRTLVEASNQRDIWGAHYGKILAGMEIPKGIKQSLPNTLFMDPTTGGYMNMTRANLLTVMLNTGTKSNLEKLAGGYGLKPADVLAWVNERATKAEWDFVQGIWDNIFADVKKLGDNVYRQMTGGVAPETIPAQAIVTPHGTYAGGYYPIRHREPETRMNKSLFDPTYYSAMPTASWAIKRTGDIRPLSLDLSELPTALSQTLHDIAMREPVINASKLFLDDKIYQTIKRNFGDEFAAELRPYIESVANSANRMTKVDVAAGKVSEYFRQNLITTLVGYNIGTVLKHGSTAAILSAREVGPLNFLKQISTVVPEQFLHWTKGLLRIDDKTSQINWEFAISRSLELQRRDRNWQETLYGATSNIINYAPGGGFPLWRHRMMEWASKPVALSDMISAVPTWLARYHEEIKDGRNEADAIYSADLAVRRAHGSTAATNRTRIQRDANPWFTGVYNFFSDIMNREMETAWRIGERAGLARPKDWEKAKLGIPAIAGSIFANYFWPGFVEEMISPLPHKPDEDRLWTYTKGSIRYLGSSWIYFRDIINAVVADRDPQLGMAGTAAKQVFDVMRDLGKENPMEEYNRGKLIQDSAELIGVLLGVTTSAMGKAGRFSHDVWYDLEDPGPWGWAVGLRYGTLKNHSKSFEDWWHPQH